MGELPTMQAGSYVRLSVRDTGCGIPASILDRIFDPYFTTKQKGSGLGLATVYSIIRKHGGLVTVDSTPGEGTTFAAYLPVSDKEPVDTETGVLPARMGTGRILVMDDEEILREVAREILVQLGYSAESCGDGQEAIRLYRKAMETEPFDAVLMDLTIPGGMGGKETMRNLLALDPKAKGIVTSGYSNDPILSHYREYGFLGVIMKPYDVDELGRVLEEVLRTAG